MSKTVEIKNNQPRLYTANGVTLQPGLNRLDEASAKSFLAHPHIQIKVDRELIVLGKNASLPKGAATATKPSTAKKEEVETSPFADVEYNIDGMNANDAMDAIDEIEDVDYLQHIVATEERKTVKTAAEARLELLAEAAENGNDGE